MNQLVQTHDELLQRLDIPYTTLTVRFDLQASRRRVWQLAAGSISRFFSHDRAFAGVTPLKGRGMAEGDRFVIHREIRGGILDRIGETLISLPMAHLTVSDIEIADPSVSGFFPALHTISLEESATVWKGTRVTLSTTTLGVSAPGEIDALLHQAAGIRAAVDDRFTLR
jgi:hypothetical protein